MIRFFTLFVNRVRGGRVCACVLALQKKTLIVSGAAKGVKEGGTPAIAKH